MTDFNYRGVAWFLLIAALAIAATCVIKANAEPANVSFNLSQGSYAVIETTDGLVNITYPNQTVNISPQVHSHYIYQGETVYLGDRLDISGVVPPYPQLAYWNGYDMYDSSPSYNITLPQQKSGYYNFTLDYETFGNRLGKWYKYNGKFERQGNNLAFIVVPRPFYNYTLTFQNGTMIYVSELPALNYVSPMPTPTPEIMPPMHVADYLITSEDQLNISTSTLTAAWIFDGRDNTILYDINNTENQIVFDKKRMEWLEPGDYKTIIQTIGNSTTNFDVIFANGNIKWFDRKLFVIREISTQNLVPSEAIRQLERIFPLTRDSYAIKNITVQDPMITIGYMSEVGVSSAKEYYHDPGMRGNVTLMDVRGYTNVLPGTNVSVTLDEAHNNPREVPKLYTYHSTAQGTYLGDMRYYRVYVPLYWDSLAPGMHNLTARTELGGYVVANFPVSEERPDSYVPPQKIRFMGDRNPWVPTPTPEIIVQKETVVVTQTIAVPVTPSEEQVTEAAKKIVDKQNSDIQTGIITAIAAVIMLIIVAWFGWSVWRAKRK